MSSKNDGDADRGEGRLSRRTWTKVLVTTVALAIAVVHVALPDLRVDAVAVALLAVAALPWLDEVFESIQTPAGGVKFREVEKRVQRLSGVTESLVTRLDTAEAVSLAESPIGPPSRESLEDLAAEYNLIREGDRGTQRTQRMTSVVARMLAAVDSGERIEVEEALEGQNPGRRLAAYALQYARPEAGFADAVVTSVVVHEPKPFGQYWGIRATSRVAEVGGPEAFSRESIEALRAFGRRLSADTDRRFELERVFGRLGLEF